MYEALQSGFHEKKTNFKFYPVVKAQLPNISTTRSLYN